MQSEIEHKFLVKGDYQSLSTNVTLMAQGYLCSSVERCVRVRLSNDKAWITVKGPTSSDGLERYEFEKEITLDEGQQLLKLCEPGVIKKRRYLVPFGNHLWEIDEFLGDNEGLIVAEIEVERKNETFELPPFVGKEVTGLARYYNASLIHYPYCKWSDNEKLT